MKFRNNRVMEKYSIFIVLFVMIIICSLLNENFLSTGNITNIIKQLSVAAILAYGEMLLIVSGMLDLSAGAVLALSGVLSVSVYKSSGSLIIALLVAVIVAVVCNIINAIMVTSFKAPPFIATLAMQTVARGIALLFTKGQNILQLDNYVVFGQGNIGPIPVSIIFLIIITIIIWYLLRHTRLGRSLYAIGGNEEAAVASGINVKLNKYKVFIINGILVGIAGVLFMSRVNAGLPNGAVGYEMEGLTAAIVGGTSFSGGIGTTMGTLTGAFIIGCLNNIMNLIGIDSYVQQIVKGVIIALAVIWDIHSKTKKTTKVVLVEEKEKVVSN
ncbi:monosaccharide ABC transporter membrane protein (CUT2 family) [Mobilisporobacter senegalensis]|uniref:Monosaccharide ABC transporter membrane protein (CUT2 family) n=1 Tax=Mobilisporobacter senegalensis TaxID=1329262 RepID=A0A3N1XVT2_9FIRM|nr:ABC transporter permease [Mobilisporobacter senegalensis]ROR29292.1 monosaccharide ABC transporter membrane protein (CUT2 family) [Mobilisporobacter senegalensis]